MAKLLIDCIFDGDMQTLIMDPATPQTEQVLIEARDKWPGTIIGIPCKVTEDGPARERLVLAGNMGSIRLADA